MYVRFLLSDHCLVLLTRLSTLVITPHENRKETDVQFSQRVNLVCSRIYSSAIWRRFIFHVWLASPDPQVGGRRPSVPTQNLQKNTHRLDTEIAIPACYIMMISGWSKHTSMRMRSPVLVRLCLGSLYLASQKDAHIPLDSCRTLMRTLPSW